jgi:outer membrane receptor protein involved in Fe transport
MKKKFNSGAIPFRIGFRFIILFLVICVGGTLKAQDKNVTVTVSGSVLDQQGKPLPGVTVVQEGTANGTITSNEGIYTLKVTGKSTLVFSFVGMESQRIQVNQRTKIDVSLQDETFGLEEVVAIGYSSQSKKKVTSSISRVNQESLQNIPAVSPVQALQGKMAGVSVPVLSGQPGAAANIVIRGGTTLRPYGNSQSGSDIGDRDASDPLVIVDGVFRNFTDVNPDDIESIQVLLSSKQNRGKG